MTRTETHSKLLLASKNSVTGDILYTFVWTYPRFILSEVNTHRMLSRNTASSRAIPNKKQRQRVLHDPVVPIHIGANQKGMQAREELAGWKRGLAVAAWKGARYPAVAASWALDKLRVHKQVTNRIIEPWTWTQQIVSATELDNLLALRNHPDAEPHFHKLASQVQDQVKIAKSILSSLAPGEKRSIGPNKNTFQILPPGEWHLPFIDKHERALSLEDKKKVSAARCARVSYCLPESCQWSTVDRDKELFERLAGGHPKHLSPLEHQAAATGQSIYVGNFKGFRQFRKEISGESGTTRR